MVKLTASTFLIASSIGIFGWGSPVSAQTVYTFPPPEPLAIDESGRSPERLAEDREAVVLGSWDYSFTMTQDDNLYVTRMFIAVFDHASLGIVSQLDCGRAMYRVVSTPLVFDHNSEAGVPMNELSINTWERFNRDLALGHAMMRTCESAAREVGANWVWD